MKILILIIVAFVLFSFMKGFFSGSTNKGKHSKKENAQVPKVQTKNNSSDLWIYSRSNFPKKGSVLLSKDMNEHYYFTDKKIPSNILNTKFSLDHFYWNGIKNTSQEINRGTTTKHKHGITRAVAGGLIAGPAGAVVGAATSKKVSKDNTITIRSQEPTTAYLELTDLQTNQNYEINLGLLNEKKVGKIENAFNVKHERKLTQDDYSQMSHQLNDLQNLMQNGIISPNEFENKKQDLINSYK